MAVATALAASLGYHLTPQDLRDAHAVWRVAVGQSEAIRDVRVLRQRVTLTAAPEMYLM